MTDTDHPVDTALRRITGQPKATDAALRAARDRLAATIEEEQTVRSNPRRLRLPRGWVAATLVGTLVLVLLAVQGLTSGPTEASLEEIIELVEISAPMALSGDEVIYIRSEARSVRILPPDAVPSSSKRDGHLAYLMLRVVERWHASDGAVHMRTLTEPPLFFTAEDEAAYYEAGLDESDGVGEASTVTIAQPTEISAWPNDEDALDDALRQQIRSDRARSEVAQYVDAALDLLRDPLASPDLRATTLRLLARLPDLRQVGAKSSGTETLAIEGEHLGIATRMTFTIDPRGNLVWEEVRTLEPHSDLRIPANTAIFTAHYTPPRVVRRVGSR